jgi:hypothetical protein
MEIMKTINQLKGLTLILGTSLFLYVSCTSSNDPGPVDCTVSDIALSFTATDPTSCVANDGTITAKATGGEGPYQFALDAQAYSSTSIFNTLGAGTYQLKLKDKNGCERGASVTLNPFGSSLSAAMVATANSGCKTNDGAITINATGGSAPYSYTINNGSATASNTFSALSAGNYSVKVIDGTGCSVTQTVKVMSGIKLSVEIKAIIDANCAVTGCHISGGAAPVSFTTLANIQSSANDIKSKTQSGEMPKNGTKLSQDKLDLIACWVEDGAPNN